MVLATFTKFQDIRNSFSRLSDFPSEAEASIQNSIQKLDKIPTVRHITDTKRYMSSKLSCEFLHIIKKKHYFTQNNTKKN